MVKTRLSLEFGVGGQEQESYSANNALVPEPIQGAPQALQGGSSNFCGPLIDFYSQTFLYDDGLDGLEELVLQAADKILRDPSGHPLPVDLVDVPLSEIQPSNDFEMYDLELSPPEAIAVKADALPEKSSGDAPEGQTYVTLVNCPNPAIPYIAANVADVQVYKCLTAITPDLGAAANGVSTAVGANEPPENMIDAAGPVAVANEEVKPKAKAGARGGEKKVPTVKGGVRKQRAKKTPSPEYKAREKERSKQNRERQKQKLEASEAEVKSLKEKISRMEKELKLKDKIISALRKNEQAIPGLKGCVAVGDPGTNPHALAPGLKA